MGVTVHISEGGIIENEEEWDFPLLSPLEIPTPFPRRKFRHLKYKIKNFPINTEKAGLQDLSTSKKFYGSC